LNGFVTDGDYLSGNTLQLAKSDLSYLDIFFVSAYAARKIYDDAWHYSNSAYGGSISLAIGSEVTK